MYPVLVIYPNLFSCLLNTGCERGHILPSLSLGSGESRMLQSADFTEHDAAHHFKRTSFSPPNYTLLRILAVCFAAAFLGGPDCWNVPMLHKTGLSLLQGP